MFMLIGIDAVTPYYMRSTYLSISTSHPIIIKIHFCYLP